MDSPGFPVGVSNLSPHMYLLYRYGEKTTPMAACLPAGLSLGCSHARLIMLVFLTLFQEISVIEILEILHVT